MEIDDTLKNRLAGVAVVTVLAVIFLPMMFDDPVEKKAQTVSQLDIPRKPEVSPLLTTTIVPDKSTEVTGNPAPVVATATEPSEALTEKPVAAAVAVTPEKVTATPESIAENKTPVEDESWEEPKPLTQQEKTVNVKPQPKSVKPKAELPVLNAEYQNKNNDSKKIQNLPSLPSLESPRPATESRRWVVQVASLSDESKAVALRDKLRAQGFPANVDTAIIKGKQVYRLRVGSQDSQQAQATRAKINQLHNVQSIAIPE
jgi:DedD protein